MYTFTNYMLKLP